MSLTPCPQDVLFRMSTTKPSADFTRTEVVAILSDPGKPTFDSRGEATCYVHIGQHSTCSVGWYIQNTRKAKPEEYADLKRELEKHFGYVLTIRQKRKVR